MPKERPIILFPEPESADRTRKNPSFIKHHTPSFSRQYDRLQPIFSVLNSAFEHKKIILQQSPMGINPDFALVFEVIGSVDNFYTAVKNNSELEWMFEGSLDGIEPDDDFYSLENEQRIDKNITGRLYCVMSNQQAMKQLLSLWERYKNGETDIFKRGFTGFRDIFVHIKNIRKWCAIDRILETKALEYWRESIEIDGNNSVPFEIELFYRNDQNKRFLAKRQISYEIQQLNGSVLQECVIDGIAYHALLVELPRKSIELLVQHYNEVNLAQVDDIMFFRPTCQSAFLSSTNTEKFDQLVPNIPANENSPIIAVFDGMPIQNHPLLKGRIIVDDPDDYANEYESKYRIHGTAMASLVIYGDLNRNDSGIGKSIYVRPILKPIEISPDEFIECVPNDKLFIDVIHCAVRRMIEGDATTEPVAPDIKVINLSIGDPVRQLATSMSPLARLLDYLSYKYMVLFVVSAGNHGEIVNLIDKEFADIKNVSIKERSKLFFDAIRVNQRNMRVLSPAESINSLTVGAIYDDFCEVGENDNLVYAVEKGMPSPTSAFGKGYLSIITPDLYYYGGRKYISNGICDKNAIRWIQSHSAPGCKVAAPYIDGTSAGQAFSFGTSSAAAQLSHEAAKCYDTLEEIFITERQEKIPSIYEAILLKAMLVHGASWNSIGSPLSEALSCSEKKLSMWLGNGIPNITKVVDECTKNRITLIGIGSLEKDEGNIFKLPLPIDFSSRQIMRKLTVTLAYFSPIEPSRHLYRSMQLWFKIEDGNKLVPTRQNTDWQSVIKGTLQHEIFYGEGPLVWNDNNVVIKVNCKENTGKCKNPIPYCLFVTFEVAEGLDIDVYSRVKTQIKQPIAVRNA